MALTAEQYIAKWCEEGEQDVVGENLTLNRGPAYPKNLQQMQADVPHGTHYTQDWGFGDDKQRFWFNPDVGFYAGYSELSHSLHIWRYPSRLTYIKHATEVGEFFQAQPFEGFDELLDLVNNPKASEKKLDTPVKRLLRINDAAFARKVLGEVSNVTPRELQVELLMEQLG